MCEACERKRSRRYFLGKLRIKIFLYKNPCSENKGSILHLKLGKSHFTIRTHASHYPNATRLDNLNSGIASRTSRRTSQNLEIYPRLIALIVT